MFENQLIIAATDGNGKIIASQPYYEFLNGTWIRELSLKLKPDEIIR